MKITVFYYFYDDSFKDIHCQEFNFVDIQTAFEFVKNIINNPRYHHFTLVENVNIKKIPWPFS